MDTHSLSQNHSICSFVTAHFPLIFLLWTRRAFYLFQALEHFTSSWRKKNLIRLHVICPNSGLSIFWSLVPFKPESTWYWYHTRVNEFDWLPVLSRPFNWCGAGRSGRSIQFHGRAYSSNYRCYSCKCRIYNVSIFNSVGKRALLDREPNQTKKVKVGFIAIRPTYTIKSTFQGYL